MRGRSAKNDVNKTEEGTRHEMASSRRVSNDVISQLLLSAPLCSAVGLGGVSSCLFGVKQPNEQQAEVRNVAPTALPSDYHTKTYLCVYSSISLFENASITPFASCCCGEVSLLLHRKQTHTHMRGCTDGQALQ
ncbi:hypothetical protein ILYODFUR_018088 [Ilyodon furcidens]|uniref:Uncharacterized protein n=1 Tax=Ilyodon furcidens TaxID=33524 RepID=A0ABV0VEY1_9TELE